ncbi:MAG TPA: methionine biosynthesis protein MetW [Acidocella sp.]|uniref:methionine biosynthesis protein MetW n=1 Tax=Acidocella sp. TaxID=50710 RepID=UPI002BFFB8EA|nr:methionine biosynthesis protein MetW [Acidocella sp.]HVE21000.1 methionine biosynthesis protein MetW [Acidocella sp.]
MRVDLALIAGMIAPKTRVLDIGCSDGALIEHLFRTKQCDARGLDLDMGAVTQAVTRGLPAMQGDADTDLTAYPDNAFDYVVLSRTLQAVEQPREVLRQMLRIGTHAIVSFPNFGHWTLRMQLLLTGRAPMTSTWNRPWYETPNIHPCSISDFFALCETDGYKVEEWLAVDEAGALTPWRRSQMLANLFGGQGLFLLRKA